MKMAGNDPDDAEDMAHWPFLMVGLVPDIAAWRRSRLAELPEGGWFDLAPDWVCEILSGFSRR